MQGVEHTQWLPMSVDGHHKAIIFPHVSGGCFDWAMAATGAGDLLKVKHLADRNSQGDWLTTITLAGRVASPKNVTQTLVVLGC